MMRCWFGLTLVIFLFLSGCATYTYKGATYHSPDAALEAQRANNQKMLSEIFTSETRKGGSAVVIIPNVETCTALGVTRRGSPSQELVDYVGKSVFLVYQGMAMSVEKSGIFGNVVVVEDESPLPASKRIRREKDAVIYLDMAGPGQVQWFLTAAPDYKDVTVHLDGSKPEGSPRLKSWLDDIANRLEQVKYRPR